MSKDAYDHILVLISERITKQDTNMRKAIPADLRLALTLHYLASGEDFRSLSKYWRVGRSTAVEIVLDTCKAIWSIIGPIYLQRPQTPEDWKAVAAGYAYQYKFQIIV